MTKKDEDEIPEDEKEKDVYSEEGREKLEEDAEISPREEGFMKGYEEDSKMTMCQNCNKVLERDVVEKEIDGEIYRFCCDRCAEEFKKK